LQKTIATPGRGILAMDESNATCGLRLASIGLDNTEVNRQAYRQLLCTTPGLGEYISGAILFEETLYQSTSEGKLMVDCLKEQNIVPGIKVDKVIQQPTTFLQHEFVPIGIYGD
jgi:fructose-bisphosphate aldolase class I